MNKQIKYISGVLFILIIGSCDKLTDVGGPATSTTNANVFQNDVTATAAVTGIYAKAMLSTISALNGGITIYPALSADELVSNGTNSAVLEFMTNSLQSSNSTIKFTLWAASYSLLYQANACIEGINGSNAISAGTKKQLLGESYFIRAFIYFNLINLFGDVPLIIATRYESNATMPRTSTTLVKDQIKKDLIAAIGLLSPDYPTANRVRVNKWAAAGLLARIDLYNENWAAAENEAGQVINSGTYSLENKLENVFLYNSRESIFQLMPVSKGYNTAEGNQLVPGTASSAIPICSLSPYLLNVFEPGDKRYDIWVGKKMVNGTIYTYPYKYTLKANFTASFVLMEYYTVLRLAEQYLIRAEARANQQNLIGALEDLDTIRSRAGLPLLSTTNPDISQQELLTAIQKERQIELFAEWGHRWFDLKRTKQADAVLKNRKPGWNSTDTLYPIPNSERLLNPNLTQNEGYN
jgi:hypothetical protein